MIDLEQKVLETFRQLSLEKQQDVVLFLDLIKQDNEFIPTDEELKKAREIIFNAKKKALSTSSKNSQDLWNKFNETKRAIANEYEQKNKQN